MVAMTQNGASNFEFLSNQKIDRSSAAEYFVEFYPIIMRRPRLLRDPAIMAAFGWDSICNRLASRNFSQQISCTLLAIKSASHGPFPCCAHIRCSLSFLSLQNNGDRCKLCPIWCMWYGDWRMPYKVSTPPLVRNVTYVLRDTLVMWWLIIAWVSIEICSNIGTDSLSFPLHSYHSSHFSSIIMPYHAFFVALTSILGGFIVYIYVVPICQILHMWLFELVLWHLNQSRPQIKHFNCKFDSFNILAGLNLGGFILGGSNVLRLPTGCTLCNCNMTGSTSPSCDYW